jgi:5-dehydro-2-deoxygluconokinase
VHLYPERIGVSLAGVKAFAKSVGDSATNVVVAAALFGHRPAVITKVGDDGLGQYSREALEGQFGVDVRLVGTDLDVGTETNEPARLTGAGG